MMKEWRTDRFGKYYEPYPNDPSRAEWSHETNHDPYCQERTPYAAQPRWTRYRECHGEE